MNHAASPPPTRVEVSRRGGRWQTRLRSSLLRPQLLHGPADRCRVALLATTALLLGGDEVRLEIDVAAGATLELSDVAGTVAYDGRGAAACWDVSIRVADGGRLRWSGQPFVVADGARVSRTLDLQLFGTAQALLRETLVLGRTGQAGGTVRNRTVVHRDGRPLLLEDLLLEPDGIRLLPGMLGQERVLDSVLALGVPLPAGPAKQPGLETFGLPEAGSTLSRRLGRALDASPLHARWAGWALPAEPTPVGSSPV